TVYVTHDQTEAMTMGDRVAVMKGGILQQVDTPLNLYDKPTNLFVAGFIGSPAMNLLSAKAAEGTAKIGGYTVPIDREAASRAHGDITVGVRPEAWRIVGEGDGGLPIKVTVVEDLGADGFVYGESDAEGAPEQIVVRIDARRNHHKGETLYVTTDPHNVHVFDSESGERLSD
ncbi:MAG: ABC transporter ATP-binding protein, partial [Nocardioidaceae bacterium]